MKAPFSSWHSADTGSAKLLRSLTEFSFGDSSFFTIKELSLLAGGVQVEETLCSDAQEHAVLVVIHGYVIQRASPNPLWVPG